MKVSELTGAQLDYWVAQADGVKVAIPSIWKDCDEPVYATVRNIRVFRYGPPTYEPSKDWALGGPLLQKYCVEPSVSRSSENEPCMALMFNDESDARPLIMQFGDTYLIAAMRAIVCSVYGEEVPE